MGISIGVSRLSVEHTARDIVPFIQACEQDRAEVDGPDAVIDFFQPDVVGVERIGANQQPALEVNGAGIGDALHEEVRGILEGRQLRRIRAG